MISNILTSFGHSDFVLFTNRLLLGAFFVLARFRFFYDPSKDTGTRWFNVARRCSLTHKMAYCGLKNRPAMWAWVAAFVEVLAGTGVILGLLTIPSALGLLVLLLVATRCTAKTKVMEQNPVDKLDCVACYLWRVEGLYIGLALTVLIGGPGKYSLDYFFGLLTI